MVAEIVDSLRYGVQIRVAQTLPMKLVLADADLGLVPLAIQAGAAPGAVLLQRSGLLAALDALFETTWRQAYPLELSKLDSDVVVEADADEPTELDRKLLGAAAGGPHRSGRRHPARPLAAHPAEKAALSDGPDRGRVAAAARVARGT